MTDFLTVSGSHGSLFVDRATGEVAVYSRGTDCDGCDDCYYAVRRVDLDEWRRHYGHELPDTLDILDCRLTLADGTVAEPEGDWRAEMRSEVAGR